MVFIDIIQATSSNILTSETTFSNYILIVDTYSKNTKLYGMERITTEEAMDKLDMFQDIFGKVDELGWWDLERISSNAETQFTSTEFQDGCPTRGVWLMLEALEHQEICGQIKVTWRTLHMIAHSLMLHTQFLEAYIHFHLMYTADHIFPDLPIKDWINEDEESNNPFKLATGTKPSIFNLLVLFCLRILRKATV